MHPGDVPIFPKGDRNGHHLVNESAAACVFVALGLPEKSPCHYPDADLLWTPEAGDTHADGTPYSPALESDSETLNRLRHRSDEHTYELQSLMRRSYAVF